MEQILDAVRAFDGVLELAPAEGGPYPEIAWGDHFFYYAPDGEVPENTQPYATIVTKDYPDDSGSRLGGGRWRLNVHVGRQRFVDLLGTDPRDASADDYSAADVVLPHPVYGPLGWISIVDPADRTMPLALELLAAAHADARTRAERRDRHPST
ncbi:hypothetical protein G5T42_09345 [Microbacterium sp. 4R-513]|nr:hypothetical protein G5T42_09345 [Microbacterium sp. 4R-513]